MIKKIATASVIGALLAVPAPASEKAAASAAEKAAASRAEKAAAQSAAPSAATAPADKPALLAKWTQPTAASSADWQAARRNRDAWTAYGFVWSTDHCSGGPERPLGFDFRLPCARHDFGYRNYRAAGTLARHRARLDRALRADLTRACARYRVVLRPICTGLAWTYYRAARRYGATQVVRA